MIIKRLYLYDPHHLRHSRDHRRHDDHEHPSFHDLYRQGFESDLFHVYRNRDHVDHLYGGNNRDRHVEAELGNVHDDEESHGLSLVHLDHDHDQSQSAMKQREVYGPTTSLSV